MAVAVEREQDGVAEPPCDALSVGVGVAGSKRLPMTTIGCAVRLFHGPV
jgi:hypothetical protein